MIFVRDHPLIAGRTFVALVATVILHAPTIVITTASLGYTNATSVTTPASVAAYTTPTDESIIASQLRRRTSQF